MGRGINRHGVVNIDSCLRLLADARPRCEVAPHVAPRHQFRLPPLSFADVADPGDKLGAWCETAIRTAPGTDDLWREQLVRIHLDEAARRRITLFQDRATARVDAFVNELDGIPDSRRGLLASTIREAVGSAVRLSALHPDDTERIAGWFAASLEAIVGNVRAENGDTAA